LSQPNGETSETPTVSQTFEVPETILENSTIGSLETSAEDNPLTDTIPTQNPEVLNQGAQENAEDLSQPSGIDPVTIAENIVLAIGLICAFLPQYLLGNMIIANAISIIGGTVGIVALIEQMTRKKSSVNNPHQK
jgi:hypothetical protein